MKHLIALIAAVTLTAGAASADPFRIIVTEDEVPLVPNSVLQLAKTEGYFDRQGVDVTLIHVKQTPMAAAALQSGSGDMANISLSALLGLHAQGAQDLVAIHSAAKTIPYVIAARDDVTLQNIIDKRFGVGQAGSLDQTLSEIVLRAKNVDAGRMTLVPTGQPAQRGQALMAGRIDATTMSIGSYLALPDHTGLKMLVDGKDFFATAPVVTKVDVVSRATLAARGDDINKVLTALTLAARDYAAHPEDWAKAMAKARPDVAPETLTELAHAYDGVWTVNGGIQKTEMYFAQNFYTKGEATNTGYLIDPNKWLDFAPMDRVLTQIGASDLGDQVSR